MDIIEPSKVAVMRNQMAVAGGGAGVAGFVQFRPNSNNGYNPRVSQHRPPAMFSGQGQTIGGAPMHNQNQNTRGYQLEMRIRQIPQAQIADSEDEEGPQIQTVDVRGLQNQPNVQPYEPVMVRPKAYTPTPVVNSRVQGQQYGNDLDLDDNDEYDGWNNNRQNGKNPRF